MPFAKTPIKVNFEEFKQLWVGKPKVGKTKTAGQIEGSVFFFTESGASDMALDHYYPKSHSLEQGGAYVMSDPADFLSALLEIRETKPEDRPTTIIFDTIDGMVKVFEHSVCRDNGEKTINDGKLAYGKGWKLVRAEIHELIEKLEKLNIGVVFISHLEEKTITRLNKEPETVWRSTLPDQAKVIIHGLVDFIWFFTQEGKKRYVYTEGDMSIEAGSRIEFPDRIEMGKNPQECYANILNAFYGRKGKGNSGKAELITLVLKGEAYLAEHKIDKFDTDKRRDNSRIKHLGTPELELSNMPKLQEYVQHLRNKSKEKK